MRDDQGDETDEACDDNRHSGAIDSLEDDTEQDGAPPDENGGRVEICNGRAAMQEHADDQACRVECKGEEEQVESGTPDRFGTANPIDASGTNGGEIKEERFIKQRSVIEPGLAGCSRDIGSETL